MSFKSGFVSILGAPNVGKSSILNKIIKEKVSIVSPKPQTTRNKILGILNENEYQIIFIDTPGIHSSKNKLDEYMQKSINSAKKDVDVILLVIDGSKPINEKIYKFIEQNSSELHNVILVVNKIDLSNYEKLYPSLDKLNKIKGIKEIIPVSALKNKNIDKLVELIKKYIPEGVRYFDTDIYTDKYVTFMVSEIIREKALYLLQDEIPHGIGIEVVNFKESEDFANISCDIICEKSSHKQIIIGKQGNMLKEIGSKSRIEIEKLLNKKVMLNLFVKVREDWRNNANLVKNLGYIDKDI